MPVICKKGKILSWALGYWDPQSPWGKPIWGATLESCGAFMKCSVGNRGITSPLLPCISIWKLRFPKRSLLNSLKEKNELFNKHTPQFYIKQALAHCSHILQATSRAWGCDPSQARDKGSVRILKKKTLSSGCWELRVNPLLK